jgi:hypothetical protein
MEIARRGRREPSFSAAHPAVPSLAFLISPIPMQTRRTGLSPLAIVLPHPPLHRRSSLLSITSAASPHTPRSSGFFDGAPPPVCYAANRKSSDSWASSNADEMDVDWKPDQILLLTRVCLFPSHFPLHCAHPCAAPSL